MYKLVNCLHTSKLKVQTHVQTVMVHQRTQHSSCINQATVYASQQYSAPVLSQDKLGGLWQKERAFSVKMGG